MEKLAPIKDFIQVSDVSLYIFIFLLSFGVLVLIFAVLRVISFLKHKQKSQIQIAKEKLKNIDFSNSKQASYDISKYAIYLTQNSSHEEFLNELNQRLAKYKYQKNVPEFSEVDKIEFKKFMELCNV